MLRIVPFIYLATPFTATISNDSVARLTFFVVWLAKTFCAVFAFPCSTIVLTNTASSLKVLGTINGVATSVGAIGRALGPTLAGAPFTWGVKRVFIPAPFMMLFCMGLFTWFPLYWMEEGEGFDNEDKEVCAEAESYKEEDPLAQESLDSGIEEVYQFQLLC